MRAAGTEDSEKQVRACSGAPSCAVLLLIWDRVGWGMGGGVGYIGKRWWAAAQSVAGVRLADCSSFTAALGHFTEPAGQSPRRGREDRDVEKKLWVSQSERVGGRGPWGGPFGGRVGVTWEGSPCNGCLGASVVSVAASSTS